MVNRSSVVGYRVGVLSGNVKVLCTNHFDAEDPGPRPTHAPVRLAPPVG